MAEKYTLECGQAGPVCRAKITGDSEEEVLAKGLEHAREKHGVDLSQSTTLTNYLRSAIRADG